MIRELGTDLMIDLTTDDKIVQEIQRAAALMSSGCMGNRSGSGWELIERG